MDILYIYSILEQECKCNFKNMVSNVDTVGLNPSLILEISGNINMFHLHCLV